MLGFGLFIFTIAAMIVFKNYGGDSGKICLGYLGMVMGAGAIQFGIRSIIKGRQ